MFDNNEAMVAQIGLNEYSIGNIQPNKETFLCEICLWSFENETELSTHNYLEHLIMKKRNSDEDG